MMGAESFSQGGEKREKIEMLSHENVARGVD